MAARQREQEDLTRRLFDSGVTDRQLRFLAKLGHRGPKPRTRLEASNEIQRLVRSRR